MTLRLTATEVRRAAEAVRALTAVHEFDGVDAWRAEASAAVRRALGGDGTLMQMPPCRSADPPDAAPAWCFTGDGVRPEIVARCEVLFRAGPRSDDPAAADVAGILDACAAAGVDTWTGPSFVAEAAVPTALPFDTRRSAFVREIIEPSNMWYGTHLRAHGPGYVAVLGTSASRLGHGGRTEAGTRLLARLLQPAFAAGVRAAVVRWCAPALPTAVASFVSGAVSRGVAVASAEREPIRPAALRPRTPFTPREGEVAALLALRRTNAEIAAALGVSTHTARHHTEHVLRKCGIASRRLVVSVIG